jgi:hypothetical protein
MTGTYLLLALAAHLQLSGVHACPSVAAVKQALAEIAPDIDGRANETAHIEATSNGDAVVRFRGATGQVRIERPLPVELSCPERARAAAVIIAAHAAAAAPEPVPAVRIRPAAAPARVEQTLPAAAEPPRILSAISEGEVAALGAVSDGGPALGGRAGLTWGVRQQDLLRLSLGYTGTASTALAAGRATWSRPFLALGYGRRFGAAATGGSFVEPGVELLASALRIGSEGFATTEDHFVFHPGLAGGLRLGHRFGSTVVAWAGLGATVWPRGQRVSLRDVPDTARIPRLEGWALLGAGFPTR